MPLKVRLEVEELTGVEFQLVPELQVVFALVVPEKVWVAACELRAAKAPESIATAENKVPRK